MKIAHFSWEYPPVIYGGLGTFAAEITQKQEHLGNEVTVFSLNQDNKCNTYEKWNGIDIYRPKILDLTRTFNLFAAHELRMWGTNLKFFADVVSYNTTSASQLVNDLVKRNNKKFDLIDAHDWLGIIGGMVIKKELNLPLVFHVHSTEYGRCGNNFYNGNSERVRSIEWCGTYHADKVIAVSGALKNEVQWMYSLPDWKVNVIYNGISYRNYDGWVSPGEIKERYHIGAFEPMVLFAGRLTSQKGPDILLEAIPFVLHNHHNAKFVFAGDGDMRGHLEHRAYELGVSHATRFVGHQNGDQLKDLFRATDCVSVPSRNEPFGIVILEAWSAGKPVVASVNGGPSEIVWHDVTGFKIYPHPESVAWGIGSLFANFEHGRWMGRNGRIAAETVFSWDTIADETLTSYFN